MGCFAWFLLVGLAWKFLGAHIVIFFLILSVVIGCIFSK